MNSLHLCYVVLVVDKLGVCACGWATKQVEMVLQNNILCNTLKMYISAFQVGSALWNELIALF